MAYKQQTELGCSPWFFNQFIACATTSEVPAKSSASFAGLKKGVSALYFLAI